MTMSSIRRIAATSMYSEPEFNTLSLLQTTERTLREDCITIRESFDGHVTRLYDSFPTCATEYWYPQAEVMMAKLFKEVRKILQKRLESSIAWHTERVEHAALEGRESDDNSEIIARRIETLVNDHEKILDNRTEQKKADDARSAYSKRIEKLDALIASLSLDWGQRQVWYSSVERIQSGY